MLGDILGEIREQLTFLESARTDPAYQVFASGRVQCPAGSKKVLWSPEQWWEAFNFVVPKTKPSLPVLCTYTCTYWNIWEGDLGRIGV